MVYEMIHGLHFYMQVRVYSEVVQFYQATNSLHAFGKL